MIHRLYILEAHAEEDTCVGGFPDLNNVSVAQRRREEEGRRRENDT